MPFSLLVYGLVVQPGILRRLDVVMRRRAYKIAVCIVVVVG